MNMCIRKLQTFQLFFYLYTARYIDVFQAHWLFKFENQAALKKSYYVTAHSVIHNMQE